MQHFKSYKLKEGKILTVKQQAIYNYIKAKRNWSPPSMDQVATALGYKSRQAVAKHLFLIARKGYKIPYAVTSKQKPLS